MAQRAVRSTEASEFDIATPTPGEYPEATVIAEGHLGPAGHLDLVQPRHERPRHDGFLDGEQLLVAVAVDQPGHAGELRLEHQPDVPWLPPRGHPGQHARSAGRVEVRAL